MLGKMEEELKQTIDIKAVIGEEYEGILSLLEEVDVSALRIIRDNFTEVFQRMDGKMGIFNGTQWVSAEEKQAFTLMNNFYKSKLEGGEVKYAYSRNAHSGRRFAKNSLQGLCRVLRHTIAKDIYYDIDIVNAHPTFLLDLCRRLQFDHPVLGAYVENRDEKILKWMGTDTPHGGVLDTREKVKSAFLAIVNGGGCGNTTNDELNEFYRRHQELLSVVSHHPAFKKYVARAKRNKICGCNIEGSTLNYFLLDVEDDVLRVMEHALHSLHIKYGALCFDGLMVYQRSVGSSKYNIAEVVSLMEESLQDCFGYPILLKVKDMDEGVPLDGLVEKREVRTDELALAETVLELFNEDYKYESTSTTLWFWIEDTRLWEKQSFGYFGIIMVTPLEVYLSQHPDKDLVEERRKALYTNSLTYNILAHIRRRVDVRRDDDFIKRFFNQSPGFFPVGNGILLNFHTNEMRLREKTDYFTMASPTVPEPVTLEGREALIKYIKDILVTESQEYVDCFLTCVAYCLTGENNKKVLMNVIGSRDGGKSLFLRLMSEIMGSFAGAVNKRVVIKKKNEAVHDSEILSLVNYRLATISELGKNQQYDVETLKAVSGGDSIDARGAGDRGTIKLLLKCVLLIATNNVPYFDDPHFASRLWCFHFKNRFERNPVVEKRMLELCPQFLSLLGEYGARYYQSGERLEQSIEVMEYTQKVIDGKDPIKRFCRKFEMTDDEKDVITRQDMLERYRIFCMEEKVSAEGRSTFYEKIEEVIGQPKQVMRGDQNVRCYIHVRWLDNEDKGPDSLATKFMINLSS